MEPSLNLQVNNRVFIRENGWTPTCVCIFNKILLQGMVGHLQVFVLSDLFSANHPIEYSETTKGLTWIIARQKLPWNRDRASTWPNYIYLAEENLAGKLSGLVNGRSSHEMPHQPIGINMTNSSSTQPERPFPIEIDPMSAWLHGKHDISFKSTAFGLPLDSNEYFIHFLVCIHFLLVCCIMRTFLNWSNLSCREESRCLLAMLSRCWRITKGSPTISFTSIITLVLEYCHLH